MKLSPREAEAIDLLRDLIRAFFSDYLHLIERDAAALLDLDRAVFPEECPDDACVVARVPVLGESEEAIVLVRIEAERSVPSQTVQSVARTLRALRLPYGAPVLPSLVFLRSGRPGVSWEAGTLPKLRNLELGRIFFTTLGLSTASAEYHLSRPEPLAWVLAMLMRPVRHSLEEHETICRGKIAAAVVDPHRRALLCRGVETFLAFTRQAATAPGPRCAPVRRSRPRSSSAAR